MKQKVISSSGVPAASSFQGSSGTPIIIDETTGRPYTKTVAGVVVPLALSSEIPTIFTPSYALLTYDVSSGTSAGSATATTWTKRELNTESDPDGLVSLSSSIFTLGAGSYRISGGQTFYSDGGTQQSFSGRIRNTSDGSTAALGITQRLHIASGESANGYTHIPPTIVTIAGSKNFELQYYAQSVASLGSAVSSGESERYAWVEIMKIAN